MHFNRLKMVLVVIIFSAFSFMASAAAMDPTKQIPPPPTATMDNATQQTSAGTTDNTIKQTSTPGTTNDTTNQNPVPGTTNDTTNQNPAPGTTNDTTNQNPTPGTMNDTTNQNPVPGTMNDTINHNSTPAATDNTTKQPSAPGNMMDSNQAESFQAICLSSWMKRETNVANMTDYKKFGEKYCACALTQPLDTDAAVDKAIQVCMSRTLLRNTMDSLEEEIGLDKASDKDVSQFCQDTWNLIYPKMNDQAKQIATSFCDCSQPKLVSLIKSSNNMADKDYYDQIDSVAASCSGPIQSSQEPAKSAN
ncbi:MULTISPECIES: hypothetical protein [Legionella]|uniref:Uncharacterized protein n=1 Tax=Legionella drozanskii LLAP-1 TaxID=1212489 RepID=A0A0W0SVG7_9GAMM|nr:MULTISPECIES: hypothetical protein [Legionella]KTC87399.1 hypothetical protein Ldro_1018 [Legionella drozanskii LLAP-1]PJE08518.1 MAG: hypothetical protein CK430_12270 [Legionella sp.]